MQRMTPSQLPRMRRGDLVIQDLSDEVLVYDKRNDQAHCLNPSAAFVWRACDGQSSPAQIAGTLTAQMKAEVSEDFVLFALNQLEKYQLLEPQAKRDSASPRESRFPLMGGLNRRQMVRTLGLTAAVALPIVTSIIAPTPVQAATCVPTGAPCNPTILCCAGLGCNPTGKCR